MQSYIVLKTNLIQAEKEFQEARQALLEAQNKFEIALLNKEQAEKDIEDLRQILMSCQVEI